jgi:hypothetical protein
MLIVSFHSIQRPLQPNFLEKKSRQIHVLIIIYDRCLSSLKPGSAYGLPAWTGVDSARLLPTTILEAALSVIFFKPAFKPIHLLNLYEREGRTGGPFVRNNMAGATLP